MIRPSYNVDVDFEFTAFNGYLCKITVFLTERLLTLDCLKRRKNNHLITLIAGCVLRQDTISVVHTLSMMNLMTDTVTYFVSFSLATDSHDGYWECYQLPGEMPATIYLFILHPPFSSITCRYQF